MTSLFLPIIPATTASDSKSDLRRAIRGAFKLALDSKECAAAIAPFKSNGMLHGHKVLDNAAAVDALIKAAPPSLRSLLSTPELNTFEKTQQLDAVLRTRFEMGKNGKLTGNMSPRYLLKHAAAEAPAASPETGSAE